MIPNCPPPHLTDESRWSKEFVDFVAKCLTKDPNQRPTAQQLLEVSILSASHAAPLRGGDGGEAASLARKQQPDEEHAGATARAEATGEARACGDEATAETGACRVSWRE